MVCVLIQLHEHSLQQMQDLSRRRAAALDYHRQQYERTHPHQQQQQQQRPVYQTDSDSFNQLRIDSDDEEGEDEIDWFIVDYRIVMPKEIPLLPLSVRPWKPASLNLVFSSYRTWNSKSVTPVRIPALPGRATIPLGSNLGQVVYSHCFSSFSAPRNWGTKREFSAPKWLWCKCARLS